MKKRENRLFFVVVIALIAVFFFRNTVYTGNVVQHKCTTPRLLTNDGTLNEETSQAVYCSQTFVGTDYIGGCMVAYTVPGKGIYALTSGPDQKWGTSDDVHITLTSDDAYARDPIIGDDGRKMLYVAGPDLDVYLRDAGFDGVLTGVGDDKTDDTVTRLTYSTTPKGEGDPQLGAAVANRAVFINHDDNTLRKCDPFPPPGSGQACSEVIYSSGDVISSLSNMGYGGERFIVEVGSGGSGKANKKLYAFNLQNNKATSIGNGDYARTDPRTENRFALTKRANNAFDVYVGDDFSGNLMKITEGDAATHTYYGASDVNDDGFAYLRFIGGAGAGKKYDVMFRQVIGPNILDEVQITDNPSAKGRSVGIPAIASDQNPDYDKKHYLVVWQDLVKHDLAYSVCGPSV